MNAAVGGAGQGAVGGAVTRVPVRVSPGRGRCRWPAPRGAATLSGTPSVVL